MLKGRLGLESARVPQADRHGVVWLGRGRLYVDDGTLRFATAGLGELEPGDYALPFQLISVIVLQPGTTVTHDALRITAAHGTAIVASSEGGTRLYASLPKGPDASARARRQARAWADPIQRALVARRMYAWRMGEVFPDADIDVLRGMEGARVRATYQRVAQQFGISWHGRRYDRANPEAADIANQALNHAAAAIRGAAELAVAITGCIPQLGFIHEQSGLAFALDIADLFRDDVTLPIAFGAARDHRRTAEANIERETRKRAAKTIHKDRIVVRMIDRIKELLDGNDDRRDA